MNPFSNLTVPRKETVQPRGLPRSSRSSPRHAVAWT